MAIYDLSHGGLPHVTGNLSSGMFPSREVGPYEHMEASAHFRPNTFVINRHMYWTRLRPMEPAASGSQALEQFLQELRRGGNDIAVGDQLNVITLPIDYALERVYVRVDNPVVGMTFDLNVVDQNGTTVLPIAAGVDGGIEHLAYNSVTDTYTEQFIPAFDVKALNGGTELYMGHNHELQMVITGLPADGIDKSQIRIAAEVSTPWMGAY